MNKKFLVSLMLIITPTLRAMEEKVLSSSEQLHVAVKEGSIEQVSTLLEQKDVDIYLQYEDDQKGVGGNGYTVLHLAASKGDSAIIGLLLEKERALKKQSSIVTWFDKDRKLTEVTTKQGATALLVALDHCHSNCVGLLIEYGACVEVDTVTFWKWGVVKSNKKNLAIGVTPLCIAAIRGSSECVKLLLNEVGGVDKMKGNRWHVFNWAVANNRIEVIRTLLSYKFFSSGIRSDPDGYEHLLIAARLGLNKMVRLLLHHGAKVYVCSRDEKTPLHKAASNGHWKVCETLLQAVIYNQLFQEITNLSLSFLGIDLPLELETFLAVLDKQTSCHMEQDKFIELLLSQWRRVVGYCKIKDEEGKTASDLARGVNEQVVKPVIHSIQVEEILEIGSLHEMLDPDNIEKVLPQLLRKWLKEQQELLEAQSCIDGEEFSRQTSEATHE